MGAFFVSEKKNKIFLLKCISYNIYIYLCFIKQNEKIKIMKIQSLISKLQKMNVSHVVLENNGYNKDIQFVLNGLTFKAGFTEGKTIVEDFCREICYDNCNQEMQRRFFDNFNQVLRYAKA
jgi:hypothetical protein